MMDVVGLAYVFLCFSSVCGFWLVFVEFLRGFWV